MSKKNVKTVLNSEIKILIYYTSTWDSLSFYCESVTHENFPINGIYRILLIFNYMYNSTYSS